MGRDIKGNLYHHRLEIPCSMMVNCKIDLVKKTVVTVMSKRQLS